MSQKATGGIRRRTLALAAATSMVAGPAALAAISPAGASVTPARTLASSSPATNGEWPGVGKICESGAGGASSVRGVGTNTIHIAVPNDASNTVVPGLEKEFVQFANAFAAWCNASGGINGRHIVIDNRDAALFNAAQVTSQSCQTDFMEVGGGMALDQPSVPVREGMRAGFDHRLHGLRRKRGSHLAGEPQRDQQQGRHCRLVRSAGQEIPPTR